MLYPSSPSTTYTAKKSCLVVGDGVEEVVVARVKHGVNHAPSNSKHGATSVLDLDVEGAVTVIGVLDLAGVTSGDEGRAAVVPSGKVLGTSGVLSSRHGDGLGESTKEEDLGESEGGDVGEGGETHAVIQDGAERNISGEVEGSREGDSELLDHHADEGGHGDTSVLDLDGATTGEAIGILHQAKRIEEVQWTGIDAEAIGGAG